MPVTYLCIKNAAKHLHRLFPQPMGLALAVIGMLWSQSSISNAQADSRPQDRSETASSYFGLPIAQPTELQARLYHGQTFLTWKEKQATAGESYRIYRYSAPITVLNIAQATLIEEVWEGSSSFWTDYWFCGGSCDNAGDNWEPRWSSQLPGPPASGNMGIPLPTSLGLYVLTLHPDDFELGVFDYYYAVTSVSSLGIENLLLFDSGNSVGPITESIEDPRPLKLQESVDGSGVTQHVYVQYMDARNWNTSFSAPNAAIQDYGQTLGTTALDNAIQYAYPYVVLEPDSAPLDDPLPVVLKLHPFLMDQIIGPDDWVNPAPSFLSNFYYPYDAIEIRPIDVGSTWWFGFPEGLDYRAYADECEATEAIADEQATIVNYTEHRIMRMVYDLLEDDDEWLGRTDPERVYVVGHSMGGGGAMALAQRYGNIFSAAYATAPVTNFKRLVDSNDGCNNPVIGWPADPECYLGFQHDLAFDVAAKWGPPGKGNPNPFQHIYPGVCDFENPKGLAIPVRSEGPGTWADHLTIYDGSNVYDWQNHIAATQTLRSLDAAPLAVRHSSDDHFVNWKYQGQSLYPQLNSSDQVWSGLIDDGLDHLLPWWFIGLSNNYKADAEDVPFFGMQAIKSETVPGMRFLSTAQSDWIFPPPSVGFWSYSADFLPGIATGSSIEWSSSWNNWGGLPLDTPDKWSVSLRTTVGFSEYVTVTPRRLQQFLVVPGETYRWRLINRIGRRVACGCVKADADGLLVIPNLLIDKRGRKLIIEPGIDTSCTFCLFDDPVDGQPINGGSKP